MNKKHISSGTTWEKTVGYSRAVRVGDQIFVSGTTAFDEQGNIVGINDPYQQTVQCIKNIETALEQLGSGLDAVVRTRIYVTDIDYWSETGRAHNEYFSDILPAASMVEVSRLIDPRLLVEIEATAVAK